ncbi:unnamed protein product, partial [Polarella glacialis]
MMAEDKWGVRRRDNGEVAQYLDSLQIESASSSPSTQSRRRSPCSGWIATTVVVVLAALALVKPTSCASVEKCASAEKEITHIYNVFASFGLATAFLHELAGLSLAYRSTRRAMHFIPHLKDALVPSALLCTTFFLLIVENLVLCFFKSPWYAHSTSLGDEVLDGKPVYTVFYLEWLVNVPILLILAGKHALLRPMAEVTRPLVVTNIYIILAWSAHFIPSVGLRYSVVAVSFGMYGWASLDMVQWVSRYHREHPDEGRLSRPFLCWALITIFGIYGIVFLGRMSGHVSIEAERLFFTFWNLGSKLLASMAIAGIRSSENHNLLLNMLVNTNTVFQRGIREVRHFVADDQDTTFFISRELVEQVDSVEGKKKDDESAPDVKEYCIITESEVVFRGSRASALALLKRNPATFRAAYEGTLEKGD